jgi:cell division protein FtsQ
MDTTMDAVIEESSARAAEADKEKEKLGVEKNLKRILTACSILLTGEMIWLLAVSPCLPLSDIDISGLDGIDRSVVLEWAGIHSKSSYVSVRTAECERALSAVPRVASALVTKRFPDSLEITLTGRLPAAAAVADVNGRTLPVFFDKEGVLFQIGGSTNNDALPVLSGLVFENIEEGLRLPAFLMPLFEDIETLQAYSPKLLSAISEIRVNKKAYGDYDLTLYTMNSPVKVHIGQRMDAEKLRYTMLMLDVLKEQSLYPDELDFRTGTASYIYNAKS